MYLEAFATTSEQTAKVFHLDVEELKQPSLKILFQNQGIYNGLIAVFLLYGTFLSENSKEIVTIFLVYAILVAVYGIITSDKMILIKQGGSPLLALASMFF